jgi:hypothetical protein
MKLGLRGRCLGRRRGSLFVPSNRVRCVTLEVAQSPESTLPITYFNGINQKLEWMAERKAKIPVMNSRCDKPSQNRINFYDHQAFKDLAKVSESSVMMIS